MARKGKRPAYNPEWNQPTHRKVNAADQLMRRACFALGWKPTTKKPGPGCRWTDLQGRLRDPEQEAEELAMHYKLALVTEKVDGGWYVEAHGPRGVKAGYRACGELPDALKEATNRAVFGALVMVYVGAGDIQVGDILLDSSAGAGKVTDIDPDGFPVLDDGMRVLWFVRQDGYRFDPTGEGEL